MAAQEFAATVWKTLSAVNVNEHTKQKGGLTYLSWAWAWSALMDRFPESTYEILPEVEQGSGSVMCGVNLTVRQGDSAITRHMWLPVMNHKNQAIINPTTKDINDCRMRCLTKAIAMFGLGFYIYAGEDLPQEDSITPEQAAGLRDALEATSSDEKSFCKLFKVATLEQLPSSRLNKAHERIEAKRQKMEAQATEYGSAA